jgi:hypothetical protein
MSERPEFEFTAEVTTDKRHAFGLSRSDAALLLTKKYDEHYSITDVIRGTDDELRKIRDAINAHLGE